MSIPAEKQFIVEWPFPLSADDYSQWGHSSAFTALHCRSRIQDRSCCTGERRCKVRRPISWRTILTRFALVAATTVAAPAQKYTTLVSFNGADGANPEFAALVQGRDRDFYGTTRGAGGNVPGTVFKVTAEGTMTTLADLGLDQPYAGLVLATDGWFYGTTAQGGANTWGTIFKMSSKGTLRPLYSFCAQPNCSDGVFPLFGLVQASNGNFYGTTPASAAVRNPGTIFQITPGGKLTTLYTFCAQTGCPDGEGPSGPLIQATNGHLYGTTGAGGAHGYGTVFGITIRGKLTTLHSFNGTDGSGPSLGLIQAADGNFYGTTQQGGANNSCVSGCGTVFKMNPKGVLKTIYSFCSLANCTDGSDPISGLVQAPDGNFYGTTAESGNIGACGGHGCGTIFKLTSEHVLTTLYTFCSQTNCSDGAGPQAGLLQATDGTFYGVTTGGGTSSAGTVFSLSVDLEPFVTFVQRSVEVGKTAEILGQCLIGASKVSFNGTPAHHFAVNSETYLTTTVPAGATTGYVTVTTPRGTLTSNVQFRVIR